MYTTLKREFAEEALASEHWSDEEEKKVEATLSSGEEVSHLLELIQPTKPTFLQLVLLV